MLDTDTFLTVLYVTVDDFCRSSGYQAYRARGERGPCASLSSSEVITLAVFGQWATFASERSFYRFAQKHLRPLFPCLPAREQFNRQMRRHHDGLVAFFLHLVEVMQAKACPFEALDGSAVAVRDCKRRGVGWLTEYTALGKGHRIGWFQGFHLITAVSPEGVITGYGIGPGNVKDQRMAETFFLLRAQPHPWMKSVGAPALGDYITDRGYSGPATHMHWRSAYGANVVCAPQKGHGPALPPMWSGWLASLRQIVESVYAKLHHVFRLNTERPHDLTGFMARLAAKVSLHNFCIWLNLQLGRERLAFADLWQP